ncbi:hypothetical protein HLB44_00880 [Aquincola sp. S2]|uniref:Uncharacterized protein n=1 Tax=Pseudaquabacterium terrae TaxID=2732868 RepID=A0ABX2E9A3_9BURK|nr:hypothetical protein [Aquabacterium terrae]NRF65526.1 hypothetical protein [Aquabacterium terrae]
MSRKPTRPTDAPAQPPLQSPMPRSEILDDEEPELRSERDIPSEEGSTERAGAAQRRSAPARRGKR